MIRKNEFSGLPPVQMEHEDDFKRDPKEFMRKNIVLCDFALGLKKGYDLDDAEVKAFTDIMNLGIIKEYYFTLTKINSKIYVLTLAIEKCDLSLCEDYVNYCESVKLQIENLEKQLEKNLIPKEKSDIAVRISNLENDIASYEVHRESLRVFLLLKNLAKKGIK